MLDSGQQNEKAEAVAKLNEMIGNKNLSKEKRLEAVDAMQLAAKQDVHECAATIIENIRILWITSKSGSSLEESYPGIEALAILGDKSLPSLIEAIKQEDEKNKVSC
jgi:hypothetical protein